MSKHVVLDGEGLSLQNFVDVARHGVRLYVKEDPELWKKIRRGRSFYVKSDAITYGGKTGVGSNVGHIIPEKERRLFQVRLMDSLSCGVGEELAEEIVRGSMVLRSNSFLKEGCSAIGADKIQMIVHLLNLGIHPVMCCDGSVGASGDLVPLASIAQVIQGKGQVRYRGELRNTEEVFKEVALNGLTLAEKEGLSLVNGTSVMTAMAALNVYDACYLVGLALAAEALAIESLQGMTDHLDDFVHKVKSHPGQQLAASILRQGLAGSRLTRDIEDLRQEASRAITDATGVVHVDVELQDPYSLRCAAQIFGPTLELLPLVEEWVLREMNSANDNPIVNFAEGKIHHTGNFSGFYVALGMDILKLALFNIADLLNTLKERLLNEKYNRGLAGSLAGENPGLNSGFKGVGLASSDIFGKIGFLANPVSLHRRATESFNQDVVSFGFSGAEYAGELVRKFEELLAATLLVVAQAVEQRCGGGDKAGEMLAPKTKAVYDQIRNQVPYLASDRPLRDDIAKIVSLLRRHEILFE